MRWRMLLFSMLILSGLAKAYFIDDFSQPVNNSWNIDVYTINQNQFYDIRQANSTLFVKISKPYYNSNFIKFYSHYIINGENYKLTFLFKKNGYGRETQGIYFNRSNFFVVGLDTDDSNKLYIHSQIDKVLYSYNPRSSDPYKNRVVNITIVRSSPFFDVYADGELIGTYYYPPIENETTPRVILWHEIMAWKSGDLNDERYLVLVEDELSGYNGRVVDVKKDNGVFNATIEITKDGRPYVNGFDSYYTHVYLEGVECQQVSYYNNFDGTYNILFYDPHVKILGHLDLKFDILMPDNSTVIANGEIVQKTRKISHLLFITGNNFYDTLFVSVLNQPVLVYERFNTTFNGSAVNMDNFQGIAEFIQRYDPNEIFYLGLDDAETFQDKFGGYVIKDREFIKENWEPDDYIVIDENRTKDILAGKIATMFNSQLTMENNWTKLSLPPERIICTFDCGIPNVTILDTEEKLKQFIKNRTRYVNSFTVVNVRSNLSGFAPQIFRYRHSIPIIINVNPSYDDITSNFRNGIFYIQEEMEKTYKWAKNLRDPLYKAKDEFFVYLLGAPYGYLYDPGLEILDDYDGDYLYTDVLYSDTNLDGEPDFAVGRITDPLQIHNANDFNSRTRKALIIGEYRHSRYFDLVPGGMESSLLAELATRSLGINTKRYAEERIQDMSEFEDDDFLDQYLTWYQLQEYFIQQILKALGIQSYVNWALTFKYALVETDWWNFIKHGELRHLERPTLNIIHDLKNKNLVFFFGLGDNYTWVLPPDEDPKNRDLIFDPYPEDTPRIHAESVINHSSIIYDDHSIGGDPGSAFIHSSLAYYGPTGIVHDPMSVANFMGYFYLFGHGKSIGSSSRPFTTKVKTYEERTTLNKIKEGISEIRRELLLKEYIQRTLYGDPMITLWENYILEQPKYKIEYSGGKFKIKIKEKPNVKLNKNTSNETNTTIPEIDDLDGYLMDYNKPIIPIKTYEFELPRGAKIKNINYTLKTHIEKNVTIPIIKPDEHYLDEEFSGQYPSNFVENITFVGLDRKKIVITVFPIVYRNITGEEAEIIDDVEIEIEYESPMEIISFHAINGTNGSNITFTADIVANGTVNVTLIIFGENRTIEINKTIDVNGEDEIKLKWINASLGNYTAALIVSQDDEEVRRYASFNVGERGVFVGTIKRFKGPNSVGYLISTPFEKLFYMKKPSYEEFSYWSENCYINIKLNNTNEIKTFVTAFGYLSIYKNATTVVRRLINPRGEIESVLNVGELEERITGDKSLRNDLSEMIQNYNSNITYLKERLESGEFPI